MKTIIGIMECSQVFLYEEVVIPATGKHQPEYNIKNVNNQWQIAA